MRGITKTAAEVPQRHHNEDRLRRADSWHQRSKEVEHDAEKFLLLWISFNAAYGFEGNPWNVDERPNESEKWRTFLRKIACLDDENYLEKKIFSTLRSPIKSLLCNQYVFQPFWYHVSGLPRTDDWMHKLRSTNRRTFDSMEGKDVYEVLKEVLYRLYTLRNQVFHGGATFATGKGQDQIRDGAQIMEALVPAILKIMRSDIERNPDSVVWGPIAYPRINYEAE